MTIGLQLRALGRFNLPEQIRLADRVYQRRKIFKHDFFAATALFELAHVNGLSTYEYPVKIVLKIARRNDFLGLPLAWLGKMICRHEWDILKRLEDIDQVPRLLARFGDYGLVYEYIEGNSLDEKPILPDDFFDHLSNLLQQIHDRNIAYVDMNKRGNILLGTDNRPFLIDFQIACHLSHRYRPLSRWADMVLRILKKEDWYHLSKHKRRLGRRLMDPDHLIALRQISHWIKIHRFLTRPLTRLRRRVLDFLFRSGHLNMDHAETTSPESDPNRWSSKKTQKFTNLK